MNEFCNLIADQKLEDPKHEKQNTSKPGGTLVVGKTS